MKKITLMVFLFIFFAGCMTTANYEKILNTWIDVDGDQLISSWGPPQSTFELSDGGKVIEYVHTRNVRMPGHSYIEPQTTYHSGTVSVYGQGDTAYGSYSGSSTTYVLKERPGRIMPLWCKTRFTINQWGKIIKWNWEGNDCVALPPK